MLYVVLELADRPKCQLIGFKDGRSSRLGILTFLCKEKLLYIYSPYPTVQLCLLESIEILTL